MIYFIHGTDEAAARGKALSVLSDFKKKRPEAEVIRLEKAVINDDVIKELLGNQGLFERKNIVFLDDVCGKESNTDALLKCWDEMHNSQNGFIFREIKVGKDFLDKISKKVFKILEYKATEKAPAFNVFSLSDAFANKNVKALWVGYRQALDAGVALELILGTLFWQAKSLLLASVCKSASEAGMKDFVFNKASAVAKKWGKDGARQAMLDILEISHKYKGLDAESSTEDGGGVGENSKGEILLEKYILGLK